MREHEHGSGLLQRAFRQELLDDAHAFNGLFDLQEMPGTANTRVVVFLLRRQYAVCLSRRGRSFEIGICADQLTGPPNSLACGQRFSVSASA